MPCSQQRREHDHEGDVEQQLRACGMPASSGNSASTIGTAPRRPTQAMNPISRAREAKGRQAQPHRQRPGDEHQHQRHGQRRASSARSSVDGVTSRPSSRNMPACASQA